MHQIQEPLKELGVIFCYLKVQWFARIYSKTHYVLLMLKKHLFQTDLMGVAARFKPGNSLQSHFSIHGDRG